MILRLGRAATIFPLCLSVGLHWLALQSLGLTPRFALQVNVPLIYRSFQRPEGFAIDRGTVSGLGDASLLSLQLVAIVWVV